MDCNSINFWFKDLGIPSRLFDTICWYLLSLMLPSDKHSQQNAEKISGKENSLFSKMLINSSDISKMTLNRALRRFLKKLMKSREKIVKDAPWTIILIIDATLHERSSMHVENAQKFNHGKGWIIGHQWTNIALLINDQLVPLPPIPFITKDECERQNIKYKTEPDKINDYLKSLSLKEILGEHKEEEILVLMDAGYDNKKIQNTLISRKWDFISGLKNTRTIYKGKNNFPRIERFFRDGRRPWEFIRIASGESKKGKLRKHSIKHLEGSLRGVKRKLQLVCSKRSRETKLKFLACSNLQVSPKSILLAYTKRWFIEIFHRNIKSYLGLEDAGVRKFKSVQAHVNWVYCAYIFLLDNFRGKTGIKSSQIRLERAINLKQKKEEVQILTRITGKQLLKSHLQSVIKHLETQKAA